MTEPKTAEQLAGEVKAAFDAKVDQVKAIANLGGTIGVSALRRKMKVAKPNNTRAGT